MTQNDKPRMIDEAVKPIASIVGLMIAVFALLSILLPKGLVQPVGTIVIGLILTAILVWLGKWNLTTALVTWVLMSVVAVVVYLVVSRPAAVVGSVTNANGAPVAGLTLVLTDSDGVDHKAVTDANGAFEIRNVPEGKFTILASNELLISGRVPSGWERIFNPRVPVYDLPYKAATATATVGASPLPPTATPTPIPTLPAIPSPSETPTAPPTATETATAIPTATLTPAPTREPFYISSPGNETHVGCPQGSACAITVRVQWVLPDLQRGRNLYVLVRPLPNDPNQSYFVQNPPVHQGQGIWQAGNVYVGVASDAPETPFWVCVVATSQELSSGQQLSTLPFGSVDCNTIYR